MKLFAFGATLIALGGAAISGERLRVAWQSMYNGATDARAANLSASAVAGTEADTAPPVAPYAWTPLFGELQPPAPPVVEVKAEPVAPPMPPKPPLPPLDTLGFSLKGVVTSGDTVWGMVSHPTGDRIVRIGDELASGVTVHRIDTAGLWVDRGEAPELLGFPKP